MKSYYLNDFNPDDIKKIKGYFLKVFLGYIEICAEDKIQEIFEKLKDISFTEEDTFNFSLKMETKGADVLAAIGVSKIERLNPFKH